MSAEVSIGSGTRLTPHPLRAVMLGEVLTTRNAKGQHGGTSRLTKEQIDDLIAYVRSL